MIDKRKLKETTQDLILTLILEVHKIEIMLYRDSSSSAIIFFKIRLKNLLFSEFEHMTLGSLVTHLILL